MIQKLQYWIKLIEHILWQRFKKNKLVYIIENAYWSIYWDGVQITRELNKQYKFPIHVLTNGVINFKNATIKEFQVLKHFRNSILHFGSRVFIHLIASQRIHPSNFIVLTIFHLEEMDFEFRKLLAIASKKTEIIHTSCKITKKQLLDLGVSELKVVVLPIVIDLKLFQTLSEEEKFSERERLNISSGRLVIGSFQKDGCGWKDGNTPKLSKGPDIFCDVVESLAKQYPIYVLLTGPARGYVINRLKVANIPFQHIYVKDYQKIGKYYNLLDLYIVSSRIEGGPKAILETLASGVPLISTRVGMAPEVLNHGENGFLVDIEDKTSIIKFAKEIIEDKELRRVFVKNGLKKVQDYDVSVLAPKYYDQIYARFLENRSI